MAPSAYFIIADITGYTYFLTQSELDHAQEILKPLFQVLLDNIKPPLCISNFQGDAILSYAPTSAISDGGNLLDAIEKIYGAYAGLLETMRLNTTCTCKACANMQQLDLKFFVHHGEYGTQELQGKKELCGPEVILIHRLMKNKVVEETGIKAYALITRPAIDALQLDRAADTEMVPYSETYEHLGQVDCFVHDLRQARHRARERRQMEWNEKETAFKAAVDIPLPQSVAWQFVTRPDIKAIYQGSTSVTIKKRTSGRTGMGTQYHCAHGTQYTDQFILDWHPFDYFLMREEIHLGLLHPVVTSCYTLSPIEGGTRMEVKMTRAKTSNPVATVIVQILWHLAIKNAMRKQYGEELASKLKERIEADKRAGIIVDSPDNIMEEEEIAASIQKKLKESS